MWPHDGGLSEESCWEATGSEVPRDGPIRSQRAKAKVAKARRERRPLMNGQMVKKISHLVRKPDSQAWGNPTGNFCANAVDAELGERIDLTIDSGCAACALLAGVASQELNRTPQEYIAANAEKIRELGFKIRALKFQNGDLQNLKFSVMDILHRPWVAACKVVAAGDQVVLQPEKQGGSFTEDVRSKRRKRILERNGVCWVVKQNSQKRLAPLVESCPNDQQIYPYAQSPVPKQTWM